MKHVGTIQWSPTFCAVEHVKCDRWCQKSDIGVESSSIGPIVLEVIEHQLEQDEVLLEIQHQRQSVSCFEEQVRKDMKLPAADASG